LATHSIRLFPLHFSSRASPCATRFRFHSNRPSFHRLSFTPPSGGSGGSDGGVGGGGGGGNNEDGMVMMMMMIIIIVIIQ